MLRKLMSYNRLRSLHYCLPKPLLPYILSLPAIWDTDIGTIATGVIYLGGSFMTL